ncbi:hypothetical protein Ctha_1511 [Chloroherpeton thalassium ATCC 35110]|uniref:Outer membrane protein beta-barrel domain-containing protein n=1 Tax=Chloroherpeton thalassium (strain ATCC 35110 / GB-78) TaxID=517418 RepID=B3QS25_CHLT3|nr:hypothetical protein [Chloroherpeton thalassium]ACF13970.1 hypothetical protein Ctha_1511 [Chloroherpeton thalassium ATCC 35110]
MNISRWFYALCVFFSCTGAACAGETDEVFYNDDFSKLSVKKSSSLNAFGGASLKSVSINSSRGIMLGLRGFWHLNENFWLGIAGYRLLSYAYDADFMFEGKASRLNAKYGGLELSYQYEMAPKVHFVLNSLVGGGLLKYEVKNKMVNEPNLGRDYFFLVEPGVSLEMDLAEGIRFALGSSYRRAFGVNYYDLNDRTLSGLNSSMYFKFKIF